jgi:hypothetical protein
VLRQSRDAAACACPPSLSSRVRHPCNVILPASSHTFLHTYIQRKYIRLEQVANQPQPQGWGRTVCSRSLPG